MSLPCFSQSKIKSSYQLKQAIGNVSKSALVKDLRLIVKKGSPNRFVGEPGHRNIQKYLTAFSREFGMTEVQTFKLPIAAGIKLYTDDFNNKVEGKFAKTSETYKKWFSFKKYMSSLLNSKSEIIGQNIIWSKKGKSPETLVIVAHYDTVSHDKKTLRVKSDSKMPGADYNASGVSIAMNLIKLLSKQELEKTIKIVFLDAQGLGFLGSHAYAKKLSKEETNLLGVINLEMLGHDSKLHDKKGKYSNFSVYSQGPKKKGYQGDLKLVNLFSEYNKKKAYNIKFEHKANNFESSDNFRFWEKGISCITFSQNWEDDFNSKGYQSSNDFPETINQSTFYKAYGYISYAVLAYALDLKRY